MGAVAAEKMGSHLHYLHSQEDQGELLSLVAFESVQRPKNVASERVMAVEARHQEWEVENHKLGLIICY